MTVYGEDSFAHLRVLKRKHYCQGNGPLRPDIRTRETSPCQKPMKYLRKETIIYAVIAAACIVLYVLIGKEAALAAAAVLAFYAVYAVLAVFVCGRKLSVSLSAQRELARGKAGRAEVTVENGSVLPAARCDVKVTAKNKLTGTGSTQVFTAGVRPKGKKVLTLDIGDAFCGVLELAAEEMTLKDPLGILGREIRIRRHPVPVLVVAELSEKAIDPEDLWHYDMESYRFAEGAVGNDTSETVGIREYLPGDNVRLIHWKLTAKTGEAQVREPGLPVDNRLMLIADKKTPEDGLAPQQISDLSEFFLSVSLALTEKGLGHTVGWYDKNKEEYITEQIAVSDDVYRVMPEFLSAPVREDEMDAAERFIESPDTEKNFAGYMIISPDEENVSSGADRLRGYGHLTVLTPDQTE